MLLIITYFSNFIYFYFNTENCAHLKTLYKFIKKNFISARNVPKVPSPKPTSVIDTVDMLDTMTTDSSGSDSETEAPSSVRLYSSKPRSLVQRRATITGASPTAKHSIDIEQFWKLLKKEHSTTFQLRDKAASCAHVNSVQMNTRPQTCLGIEQRALKGASSMGDGKKVKFQDVLAEIENEQKLEKLNAENIFASILNKQLGTW